MRRIWSLPGQAGQSTHLVDALGLSPVVAGILYQRGLTEVEETLEFLRPTLLNSPSPFCFPDMALAVERLIRALESGEKILIYGDYDVDGVTSVALLYKVLTGLGFQAVAYIPHRLEEGYGLHQEPIVRAGQAQVKVIITVDCGISACAEIELARELGIDVILTDHHEPPSTLPRALAIINPKLGGYPFRELAGVGVAFKLAQALFQAVKPKDEGVIGISEREILDLVALGTIADVVPLVGENRAFVKEGLQQMEETVHTGLKALLRECGLENKSLKAGQIAFLVAPRINAAGRMDSAKAGLQLLLTKDPEKAQDLARWLNKENQIRQETEKRILSQAIAELEKQPLPRVIVLSSPEWHHGVIGIVASRLVERYYRPVFLIGEDGEEGKGSARGIPEYHVLEQLSGHANLLSKFGGHRQAAGFSLRITEISHLREGLNQAAKDLPEDIFQEKMFIDSEVRLAEINEKLVEDLEQLAPFGAGNPSPVLAAFGLPLAGLSCVGLEKNHLKFRFGERGTWEGIAFRRGERFPEFAGQKSVDAAFSLTINTFQDQRQVQLVLQDIQIKAQLDMSPEFEASTSPLRNRTPDKDTLYSQIAAASAVNEAKSGPKTEWLDWRKLARPVWLEETQGKKTLIWTRSGLISLADFLTEDQVFGEPEHFSTKGWDLGIILGLPIGEDEFHKGLEIFNNLGIKSIALAEFQAEAEGDNSWSTGYWKREDLVKIYLELRDCAKAQNPFLWGTLENSRVKTGNFPERDQQHKEIKAQTLSGTETKNPQREPQTSNSRTLTPYMARSTDRSCAIHGTRGISPSMDKPAPLPSMAPAASVHPWTSLGTSCAVVEIAGALKIFEELGLIRCIGGTYPWRIELLPVEGKLDLESSLRYRTARLRWLNSRKFREVLLREPIGELKNKVGE